MTTVLPLILCAVVYGLVWLRILVHAFGRSVGTGALVAAMPLYVFVYAFTQFEHRRKGWIACGLVAFFVLTLTFLALHLAQSTAPEPPAFPVPVPDLGS